VTELDSTLSDWRIVNIDGFMSHIGPLLKRRVSADLDVYALKATPEHKNRIGLVHGGVIASLLDQVLAIEAWKAASQQPTVTVQMDTRFLGPARIGDFMQARATIRQITRSLIFVDGDVTCGDTMIATATAIMKVTKNAG
jgi:uncharacterized protein (TIGR00369 family)